MKKLQGTMTQETYWLSRDKTYERNCPFYKIWFGVKSPILKVSNNFTHHQLIAYSEVVGTKLVGCLLYDFARTILPYIRPGQCVQIKQVNGTWAKVK